MHFKSTIFMGAAILALGAPQAMADNYQNRTAGFTSHHMVEGKSYENYAEQLSAERKLGLREYIDYELREPCQFYQKVPEGFVRDGCDIEQKVYRQAEVRTPRRQVQERNVLETYEVHFEFDSTQIEPMAQDTLERVAREIRQYNADEVVVAGHTDRSGPARYNARLSQERAQAVSNALTRMGVENRVLNKKAYGEQMPQVETGDGVKLRENRRVEIRFLQS